MTKDKSLIQSCVDHINTAVDVDPWAKELVAEMGKEILEQLNNSTQEVKNSNDCISRQALISTILGMTTFGNVHELNEFVHKCHLDGAHMGGLRDAVFAIVNAPSAQPERTDKHTETHACDCISRQAAIDLLKQMRKDGNMIPWEGKDVFARIRKLPSAQPDIIRCRNCKFASGDSRICMQFGHSPIGELDFCAWAERRTDE